MQTSNESGPIGTKKVTLEAALSAAIEALAGLDVGVLEELATVTADFDPPRSREQWRRSLEKRWVLGRLIADTGRRRAMLARIGAAPWRFEGSFDASVRSPDVGPPAGPGRADGEVDGLAQVRLERNASEAETRWAH